MKTIYRNHPFYEIIKRACDEVRCGFAGFEILADRPLNHGHLVVCRAWFGAFSHRRPGECEYRFVIDEDDKVHTLDHTSIHHGRRGHTIRECGASELRASLKVF